LICCLLHLLLLLLDHLHRLCLVEGLGFRV